MRVSIVKHKTKIMQLLLSFAFLQTGIASSTALSWWDEIPVLLPVEDIMPPKLRPFSPPTAARPLLPGTPKILPVTYISPQTARTTTTANCNNQEAWTLTDACILRTSANRQGLMNLMSYLQRTPMQKRVAPHWANISNAALLQTVQEVQSWEEGRTPFSFQERFSLREVASHKNAARADYTGYFTPVLEVSPYPDQEFRFPLYAPPKSSRRLSRDQINAGALKGRGLEIGWTNDRINLFFAHVQGSAMARYRDGTEKFLQYAADNGQPYGSVAGYIRKSGYMNGGSLSNASIRSWLHTQPKERIDEVLHQNPRYVFFKLSDSRPRTATGSPVIDEHTVAVDDRYIPLGAILLAEIPRIDAAGKQIGTDWKLLFAQDRGNAIVGPGRLDIYTGSGNNAELKTYRLTGGHKTYMLVRKPGFTGNNFAGL